jgi:bleomycin hydrolase
MADGATTEAEEHNGLDETSKMPFTAHLAELRARFDANPHNRLMQNAVTQTPVDKLALRRDIVTNTDHTFSHWLDDWSVTNQKRSGRCWIFAGLNLLRVGAMKKMSLKGFEFSQNYVLFWDKLERANYFLESMIDLAGRPVDDRLVAFLLDHPLDDGGQWNMFVNVIQKHGVVPKAMMPETESSSNTGSMNKILVRKLCEDAKRLRDVAAGLEPRGEDAARVALRRGKQEMLDEIYRILSIHLGTPPAQFDWQWNDDEKEFHRDGRMTPQQFAAKYVTLPVDEYVCLVNDPRPTSPIGKTYTVDRLGNVVGGNIVKYLNVDAGLMKQIAMRTILDGEPVWMGCDVGKMMDRELGLWDAELFDYEGIYQTRFGLDKASRLIYHQAQMTHAMLFTGVDVIDADGGPKPRRWRVENSWGDDKGRKGFYLMNDSWFDEHMFEIAARKRYLQPKLQDALDLEPIVLPAWDPMGSLARSA